MRRLTLAVLLSLGAVLLIASRLAPAQAPRVHLHCTDDLMAVKGDTTWIDRMCVRERP